MSKPVVRIVLIIIGLVFLLYLLLPSPANPPPLPDSVKSTEAGDTVQVPGVSAYFSQHKRDFVVKFYQEKFDQISVLGIRLPSYKLNHPPQFAHEKIRSQVLSSYFEEVVHPFRESLFINGWEPETFFAGNLGAISRHAQILDGTQYFSKTTLRPFYSSLTARLVNFVGISFSAAILYFLAKRIIFER